MTKARIAIFEDDVVNRFLYRRVLEKSDQTFQIFDHPYKDINPDQVFPFDIVFIEVHFWSDQGGLKILERLRPIAAPNTIFIAMTSLLQRGDIERFMDAGFTLCIEKPIVFSDFFAKSAMRMSG